MEWTKNKPQQFGFYWYLVDKVLHPDLKKEFYEPALMEVVFDRRGINKTLRDIKNPDQEISLDDPRLDGYFAKCEPPVLPEGY